jgi:hypothetical protein
MRYGVVHKRLRRAQDVSAEMLGRSTARKTANLEHKDLKAERSIHVHKMSFS